MANEKLKFKLALYSTYWSKAPFVTIRVKEKQSDDDTKNYFDYDSNKPIINLNPSYFSGEIANAEASPKVIEFEHFCEENKKYQLIIEISGKDSTQTVLNSKGQILRDQLLHIKQIEIDEIDLGALVYEGLYTPTYPEPWHSQQVKKGTPPEKSFKNVTTMGHNGTWTLEFQSPFYMWLLENLY